MASAQPDSTDSNERGEKPKSPTPFTPSNDGDPNDDIKSTETDNENSSHLNDTMDNIMLESLNASSTSFNHNTTSKKRKKNPTIAGKKPHKRQRISTTTTTSDNIHDGAKDAMNQMMHQVKQTKVCFKMVSPSKEAMQKKKKKKKKTDVNGINNRFYDIEPKEKEKLNNIFGKFNTTQAKQALTDLYEACKNPMVPPDELQEFRDVLSALIEYCEEKHIFLDECEKVYQDLTKEVSNRESFLEDLEFEESERPENFSYLAETLVGKLTIGLAKYFNADFNVVLLPLLTFASTFLCHVAFKTSPKYNTNCNLYTFVVANPGAKKSPVTSTIQRYVNEIIKVIAKFAADVEHFWIDGILNLIQTGSCSLARNCQLTEQAAGIQMAVADELASASTTFQLGKKADESEGIAFLTTAYDCKTLYREFCDAKYVSFIQRPYVSILFLTQPYLMRAFLGGIKSQMGYTARNLISFVNLHSGVTKSSRYGDLGQLTLWQSKMIETVLDSTFKSLGVLLFSNLRNKRSKLIVKYGPKCELIMVAFDHLLQKIRDEYLQLNDNDNDPNYDSDFVNSLSKGLTQIDKIIANLYMFNYFAEKPIQGVYKMGKEWYKRHVQHGKLNDVTFIIDDPTILYAGMEVLLDCKISELIVKSKSIPWISFDTHNYMNQHVFKNNFVPKRTTHNVNNQDSPDELATSSSDATSLININSQNDLGKTATSLSEATTTTSLSAATTTNNDSQNAVHETSHLPDINDQDALSEFDTTTASTHIDNANASNVTEISINPERPFLNINEDEDSTALSSASSSPSSSPPPPPSPSPSLSASPSPSPAQTTKALPSNYASKKLKKANAKCAHNIMSLFVTMPGSHVNLNYLKTSIRYKWLSKQLPDSWKDKDAFHEVVNESMGKKNNYYLEHIAAVLHHTYGFGFLVQNSKIPGSKMIYVKPAITEKLKIYVEKLRLLRTDPSIQMNSYVEAPLTNEILDAFYSMGCAPSWYMDQYEQENIYSSYSNNNKTTMARDKIQKEYKKHFDYNDLMNGKSKFAKKTGSTKFIDDAQETFTNHHSAIILPKDGKTDIHHLLLSLELDYEETKTNTETKNESPIQKKQKCRYFWQPKYMSRGKGYHKLRELPKLIEKYFKSKDGKKVIKSNIADKTQFALTAFNKWNLDADLFKFAASYTRVKDQENYNILHKKGQLPKNWNPSKTPKKSQT